MQNTETAIEHKNIALNVINSKFNLNSTLINTYGREKVIKSFLKLTINKFNFTKDLLVLLERMGEYVLRNNEEDYYSELIVRLPELIIRGLDNKALPRAFKRFLVR